MDNTVSTSSGRHPVNIGHLVMGVAFLGLVGVWALIEGDVVGDSEIRWLLPVPWVLAGIGGLLATTRAARRRDTPGSEDPPPDPPPPPAKWEKWSPRWEKWPAAAATSPTSLGISATSRGISATSRGTSATSRGEG